MRARARVCVCVRARARAASFHRTQHRQPCTRVGGERSLRVQKVCAAALCNTASGSTLLSAAVLTHHCVGASAAKNVVGA